MQLIMKAIPSDTEYKPNSCCLRNIFIFIIRLGLGGEKIQQALITHQVEWKDVFIREVVQLEIEKFMFLLFLLFLLLLFLLFDEGVTLTLVKAETESHKPTITKPYIYHHHHVYK